MKAIRFIGSIFIFSLFISADEPPSFEHFQIYSKNKKYYARVTSTEKKDKHLKKDSWFLTVYKKSDKKEIWKCAYEYDGYPGGTLSDDGKVFAYINYWFYEDFPVILIYKEGKRIKRISGKELDFNRNVLAQTASHFIWMDPGKGQIATDDSLEFFLRDGKKLKINF